MNRNKSMSHMLLTYQLGRSECINLQCSRGKTERQVNDKMSARDAA